MDALILIVGAGPTGLMLALQLARRGIAFDHVDAAKGPGETSRALTVHARTLEFYEQLGLADDILPLGEVAESVRLREDGVDRLHLPLGQIGAGVSRFPFIFMLAQDDHERFLLRCLADLGVEPRRSTRLVGLAERDDHVEVTLERDGVEAVRRYARVCGADGAHSAVRHALGTGFEGGSYDGLFFVADVRGEGAVLGEMTISMSGGSFMLMMPVRHGGGLRLVGAVDENEEDVTFELMRPRLEALMGTPIVEVNWFSTYRVHHRVAAAFSTQRCFLLGDAGHLHSPAGGQGMNTGIGDAVNLAWKLAAVENGAPPALLSSYDAERRPFARRLVATTDRLFSLVTNEGVVGMGLRRFALPHVAPLLLRSERVRRTFFRTVSQVAIAYPDSPLSEGRAGDIRGGQRLPWLAEPDNYAPLRSLDWHVQVFGDVPLAEAPVPVARFEWSHAAAEAGFARDAAYLVRPDGHCALARSVADSAEIKRFLSSARPPAVA